MYQLVRIAQLIGLNAVPGFGFLSLKWTAGTVLMLYWIENLFGSVLIALRIDLHRRLTRKRGHYVSHNTGVTIGDGPNKKTVGTIFASFLLTSIIFTLVEGIFLVALLTQLPDSDAVDFNSLRLGVRLVGGFLAAGFLIDLIGIRQRPFFWVHRIADAMVARVLVMFFVVLIGVWAVAFFNASRAFIIVFLILKTFVDIRSELPESETGEAPQWQMAIAGLFGAARKAKFAAQIREANRKYSTYSPDDEDVMDVA